MPSTLMPTPEDPDPVGESSLEAPLDPEVQSILDFLRGEYASAAHSSACTVRPGPAPGGPEQGEPHVRDGGPTRRDGLVYLPAAWHCYAIVQYDPASTRLVRRVVGPFADVASAEYYAHQGSYHLYDIVPATAVIPAVREHLDRRS